MDDSAQRKPHNLYAMEAVCCPWWRHNQFEEPSSHEASCDVRTMISLRVTRRLRESSFETFLSVRRDKRGSSSLYSHCSTTVNWLTDSYDKQLTGLAFACRFTALVKCSVPLMINLYMVGVFYLECRMAKRIKEKDRSAGSLHGELIQPWFIAAAPLCYLFNPAYPQCECPEINCVDSR